ncbi:MAG TPA: ATP-dependent DNA helicase RecG [Candidatus Saccharimonadales bacterium]|nr:ATP-dependent DNA helicase RecG [Candidatus Saccharimonadales bacterium]
MNLQSPITTGGRNLKMYATRLENLGIFTFEDFLMHLPARYEDYSIVSKINQVQNGETVTIQGQVVDVKNQYLRGGRIRTYQKAIVTDDTGEIQLLWFNQPFLIKSIPIGAKISVSGRVETTARTKSIKSPVFEILFDDKNIHTGRLIPVYPETKGITSKWLRRQIYNILSQFENELIEYLPTKVLSENKFPEYAKAIKEVHFPTSLEKAEIARSRLGFDELLFLQLAANKRRGAWRKKTIGNLFKIAEYEKDLDKLIGSLPFTLTDSQINALNEIKKDLNSNKPMNRLLQGDVGSGKTVVAAIAMYLAHLNGFQSVLMAPTEILAQQHFKTIDQFLSKFGLRVKLVTSNTKLTEEFDILVGTHSVLSEKIKFSNLGLIVIDEQQRFGVQQRSVIREKGKNPHLLTMTATPIPRTVALTMYGDLDLSYLRDMPKNRLRIKTWLVPPEKREPGYEWIRKQIIETKSQVFVICPFIEQSESMQTIKAASKEYERLRKEVFPDLKLGLLHGKLKGREKTEVLNKFRDGEFDILVATPVVEVGIDIPNATIIMIEAAERFGLAQLHQLRGRVGRGDKQSYCLLFTDNETAQTSTRLKGMESLYSGAELAELDLKIRGMGNMYGTAQHGIPSLKAASFSDTNLIIKAKNEADKLFPVLSKYPMLEKKVDDITVEVVSPD